MVVVTMLFVMPDPSIEEGNDDDDNDDTEGEKGRSATPL